MLFRLPTVLKTVFGAVYFKSALLGLFSTIPYPLPPPPMYTMGPHTSWYTA